MKTTLKIIIISVSATLLVVLAVVGAVTKSRKLANFLFELRYRKAFFGSGYVDQILNVSERSQPVNVTLSNPTFVKTGFYSFVVDPHRLQEIGHLEGWTASARDVVTLECNGVTKVFQIP